MSIRATEKQLKFIDAISNTTKIKFEGETKSEAQKYISENIGKFHEITAQKKISRALQADADDGLGSCYGNGFEDDGNWHDGQW